MHVNKVCLVKAKQGAHKQSCHSSTQKHKGQAKSTHHVTYVTPENQSYLLFSLPGYRANPMLVTVRVHNADLLLEVDTGVSASTISEENYQSLTLPMWGRPPLHLSHTRFLTYTEGRAGNEGLHHCDCGV